MARAARRTLAILMTLVGATSAAALTVLPASPAGGEEPLLPDLTGTVEAVQLPPVNPPDLGPVLTPLVDLTTDTYTAVRPTVQEIPEVGPPLVATLDPLFGILGQAQFMVEVWDSDDHSLLYRTEAVAGTPESIDFDAARPGAELMATVATAFTYGQPGVWVSINAVHGSEPVEDVMVTLLAKVDDTQNLRVGYDAQDRAIPDSWVVDTVVDDVVLGRVQTNAIDAALGTIVQILTPSGTPTTLVDARLDPMPGEVGFEVELGAGKRFLIDAPGSTVGLGITIPGPNGDTRIGTATSALPVGLIGARAGSVQVELDANNDVHYDAGGELEWAVIEFDTPATPDDVLTSDANEATPSASVRAELSGLPTSVDLTRPSDTSFKVTAPGGIDDTLLRVGLDRGFDPAEVTDPDDLVQIAEHADKSLQLTTRIRGIQEAVADWGSPLTIDLVHDSGPLHLVGTLQGFEVDATLRDLPGDLVLTVDGTTGGITYTADAPIATADALVKRTDGAALFGRITQLDATLEGVPGDLDFGVASAEGGSVLGFGTGGSPLGRLDLELTSGGSQRLPTGQEGILFWNLHDRSHVHARLSNVRSAMLALSGGCTTVQAGSEFQPQIDDCSAHVTADIVRTTIGTIWFDMRTAKENPDGSMRAENDTVMLHADALPQDVHLVLSNRSRKTGPFKLPVANLQVPPTSRQDELRVSYTGKDLEGNLRSYNGSALYFDAINVGDGTSITGRLDPLPTTAGFCHTALDNRCAPETPFGITNNGSIAIELGSRATANLDICDKDSKCVDIENLSLKVVRFASSAGGGDWDNVFLDTDFKELVGKITTPAVRVEVPVGFWTDNRGIQYVTHPHIRPDPRGRIACPAGTSVWVRLVLEFNLASYLCDRAYPNGPGHHEAPTPPQPD